MSNDKSSIDRKALAAAAALVRPALASQAYIPALTHIHFDGKHATAFNDISAISVRCELDLKRCLPGEFLIRTLASFNSDTIMMQENKNGEILISSGRAKVKVPTLDPKDFPLEIPQDNAPSIELDATILKGIERCLISVGNDPTHPAQMGVTLDADAKGQAVLFSTDNVTLSRFQTKSKIKLPGEAPVILPTFFCEQLVKLAGEFPESSIALFMYAGGLLAEIGASATIFTKTLIDQEPLDFPKVVAKIAGDVTQLKDKLSPIPSGFDTALDRALLILGGEVDKVMAIGVGDGLFQMHSESAFGHADDRFTFDGNWSERSFCINPTFAARAGKHCASMGFFDKVLVMADESAEFVHLIAHIATGK